MAPPPQTDSERVLDEARTLKDMAERVLANGPEPVYATEKLRRAHAASVRALIHGLQTDPHELIDTITKERAQRTIRQREARWRWGSCPRCDADAWIVTPDADRAVCSRGCDNARQLWDLLENQYRWEREYAERFGAQHDFHSFDDRGRPGAREASRQ